MSIDSKDGNGFSNNANEVSRNRDNRTQGKRVGEIRSKPGKASLIRINPLKAPSPSAMRWQGDGIDHINISRHAATDLGFALNHSSPLSFKHNIFGHFGSMETFWHYIQSEERDDRIRDMNGPVLQQFTGMLTRVTVTNFRAIIMDSNYQRIKAYEEVKEAFIESALPFDCYNVNSAGIRIRPKFFKWLTVGFEEIRAAMKEGREPDFKIFLDNQNSGIYDYVTPDAHIKRDTGRSRPNRSFQSRNQVTR